MMKTFLMMGSIFFTAGMGLVHVPNALGTDLKSAGYQRIFEIRNRMAEKHYGLFFEANPS